MNKKNYLYLILLSLQYTYAVEESILFISIPKAGTHLVSKIINLVKPDYESISLNIGKSMEFFSQGLTNSFIHTHMVFNSSTGELLGHKKIKKLILIRDPRDLIISFVHYMHYASYFWPESINISKDDLIMNLIESGSLRNNIPTVSGGINQLYQAYLPWMDVHGFLTLRFEELVGERGGGSRHAQITTLKKLLHHLDIPYDDDYIATIADNIFGGTFTFREGQIGSWKKHFNEEHKAAFKKYAGQLLIDLGYEKDMNW